MSADGGAEADAGTALDSGARTVDAHVAIDGSVVPDGGEPQDAAPRGDGGSCLPEAVRFEYLARGPLREGNLCDELFVCVRDEAEAEAVRATSERFACSTVPSALCEGASCSYRFSDGPRVLNAADVETICTVTLLTPTPDLVCVVYGP